MSITFSQLEKKIKSKEIDTVLVSLSDMQGRLVGKRVTGKAFLDYVHKETHFCDYLYTVDMDMYTVPGFKSSSWETGYGDMTVIPDKNTIKILGPAHLGPGPGYFWTQCPFGCQAPVLDPGPIAFWALCP